MPKARPVAQQRKRRVRVAKAAPFPVPIETVTGETAENRNWMYYTGMLGSHSVVVRHSGDMDFLYRMGFFGKGDMSRGQPEWSQHWRVAALPWKSAESGGLQTTLRARVTSRRRYSTHLAWHLLSGGDQTGVDMVRQDQDYLVEQPGQSRTDPLHTGSSAMDITEHHPGSQAEKQQDTDTVLAEGDAEHPVAHTDWEEGEEGDVEVWGVSQRSADPVAASWDVQGPGDADFWSTGTAQPSASTASGSGTCEGLDTSVSGGTEGLAGAVGSSAVEGLVGALDDSVVEGSVDSVDNSAVRGSTESRGSSALKGSVHYVNNLTVKGSTSSMSNSTLKRLTHSLSDSTVKGSAHSVSTSQNISTSVKQTPQTGELPPSPGHGCLSSVDSAASSSANHVHEVMGDDKSRSEHAVCKEHSDKSVCTAEASAIPAASANDRGTDCRDRATLTDGQGSTRLTGYEKPFDGEANENDGEANENDDVANENDDVANENDDVANENDDVANENDGEANENDGEANENDGEANENDGEANENDGEANEYDGQANENDGEANENDGEANENAPVPSFDGETNENPPGSTDLSRPWSELCGEDDAVSPQSSRTVFVVPDSDEEEALPDGRVCRTKTRWRPVVKRDPYLVEENLHLNYEEAFFLSYGLGCITVLDSQQNPMDLQQLWHEFCHRQPDFVPNYIAYHYYRSKNWVPKTGLKFGCTFLLYKDGPPFFHGSYSVVVKFVDAEGNAVPGYGGQRQFSWTSLAGLKRITEHVGKELMFCYVVKPADLSADQMLSPSCIPRFQVKEMVVSRWVSSQEREGKALEEMP